MAAVTIISYYVSSNSNSNVATVNINGSTMTVYGNSYGSDNIMVCQSNYQYNGQCGTLYVSVGYGNNNGYAPTAVTFSQSSPNLSVGQSMTISIYGGSNVNGNYYSGNYYIGYNSNSSSVQTSLSGSTLTLTGQSNSVTVIVVCASTNSCGALTVTVGQTGTSRKRPKLELLRQRRSILQFFGNENRQIRSQRQLLLSDAYERSPVFKLRFWRPIIRSC